MDVGREIVPQPAVAVRGVTKAEADRLEAEAKAADAAAWDAAAARAPDASAVSGVTGPNTHNVNGAYDRVRPALGAPRTKGWDEERFNGHHWWLARGDGQEARLCGAV